MRKMPPKTETNMLIPTKAALFGLEVRFKPVDDRLMEERKRRTAFKRPRTKENGRAMNKYQLPMERRLLSGQCNRNELLRGLQDYAQHNEVERQDGLKI